MATWQCKSKDKWIDFYPWGPWWEVSPLERPLFWCKRGGLTRGFSLYWQRVPNLLSWFFITKESIERMLKRVMVDVLQAKRWQSEKYIWIFTVYLWIIIEIKRFQHTPPPPPPPSPLKVSFNWIFCSNKYSCCCTMNHYANPWWNNEEWIWIFHAYKTVFIFYNLCIHQVYSSYNIMNSNMASIWVNLSPS